MDVIGLVLTVLGICAATMLGAVLGERLGVLTGIWGKLVKAGCGVLLAIIVVGAAKALFGEDNRVLSLAVVGAVLLLAEWISDEKRMQGYGTLLAAAVIALHHVPEGMAAGLSCTAGGSGCAAVCGAVVLHLIPETMVLMPMLQGEGYSRCSAYAAAGISGIMGIVGVLLGCCI